MRILRICLLEATINAFRDKFSIENHNPFHAQFYRFQEYNDLHSIDVSGLRLSVCDWLLHAIRSTSNWLWMCSAADFFFSSHSSDFFLTEFALILARSRALFAVCLMFVVVEFLFGLFRLQFLHKLRSTRFAFTPNQISSFGQAEPGSIYYILQIFTRTATHLHARYKKKPSFNPLRWFRSLRSFGQTLTTRPNIQAWLSRSQPISARKLWFGWILILNLGYHTIFFALFRRFRSSSSTTTVQITDNIFVSMLNNTNRAREFFSLTIFNLWCWMLFLATLGICS